MKYAKWKIILSSLIVAAPWAVMVIMGGRPGILAFGAMLLLGHWLCLYFTVKDPGNMQQSQRVMEMLLWVLPIISLFCAWTFWTTLQSGDANVTTAGIAFFGVLSLVIGNYLPKCRQNSTVGIKIKWTLENEENWNATHRFSGRVWVLCSLGFFILSALPVTWAVLGLAALVIVMVSVPTWYSWHYARQQIAAGTYTVSRAKTPKMGKGSLVILAAILIIVSVLMFTGTVKTQLNETALTVKPTYYPSVTLRYEDISQIALTENYDGGVRTFGFSSPKLSLGSYRSNQFGNYSRYTCAASSVAIIIEAKGQTYLLSGANNEDTHALFTELLKHIGN